MAKAPKAAKKAPVAKKAKAAPKNKFKGPFKKFPVTAPGPTAAQAAAAQTKATRNYQLQYAARTQGQANVAFKRARMLKIAAYAIKRTFQIAAQGSTGNQQGAMIKALQSRASNAGQSAITQQNSAVAAQAYAHKQLMGTMTNKQAAAANKKFNFSPKQWTAYLAKLTKQVKQAKATVKALTGKKRGRPLGSGQAKQLQSAQKVIAASAAATKKAPVQARKTRGAIAPVKTDYVSGHNDIYDSCIAVAITNRLNQLGYNLYDEDALVLMHIIGENCTIADGLERFCNTFPGFTYLPVPASCFTIELQPGDIIGFEADTGDHAAMVLTGKTMISWGQELPSPPAGKIDEVWYFGREA